MTFSGAQADINAALAGMTYAPTANDNGLHGFSYSVTDGVATVSGNVDVNVTPVNDPATISGTATGSVTEDGTLTAGGTLTVNDVDTGESHFQTPASLAGTYGGVMGAASLVRPSQNPAFNLPDYLSSGSSPCGKPL